MHRFALIAALLAAIAMTSGGEARAQTSMLADTSQFSDCVWNGLDASAQAAATSVVPRLRDMAPQISAALPSVAGCGGDDSAATMGVVVDVITANTFMIRGAQELATRGVTAETLTHIYEDLSPEHLTIFSHVTDGTGRATPELRESMHARCAALNLNTDADCVWLSIYLMGRATYARLHTPGGYL